MSIYQSNYTDRQLFTNAEAAMIAAGISKTAYDNAVKTQCLLRLIQPLSAGQQFVSFPVLSNATNAGLPTRSDEIRLPQQNAFFVGQWDFTIFKTTTAGLLNPIPGRYPNAITYPTGSASLYTLYNGKLQIVIDQSVIVRAYSMRKFLNVPQTQLTGAATPPQDQFDGTYMLPVEPNIVFVGTAQIDINIILPTALGTIDNFTYCCFDFFGIEAQNVALGAIQ